MNAIARRILSGDKIFRPKFFAEARRMKTHLRIRIRFGIRDCGMRGGFAQTNQH